MKLYLSRGSGNAYKVGVLPALLKAPYEQVILDTRGISRNTWTAGTFKQCQATGRVALNVLEQRLQTHNWLAFDRPTVSRYRMLSVRRNGAGGQSAARSVPSVVAWPARKE